MNASCPPGFIIKQVRALGSEKIETVRLVRWSKRKEMAEYQPKEQKGKGTQSRHKSRKEEEVEEKTRGKSRGHILP